ncbi:FG-GAP repeat protein [Streptomyces actinomycinicus]|uniref:FG-GAP repeat protein n=1 Tax=Streptomyces actinomycinicus TaxID=1695166 RepID=A0A937EEQ6_9ACTN|nr:FG-GAP-like repeat-containing protein [Streptomyces actinomycinicus]MBL1080744.1 FG-GAP repeat protein [Streptomyces actinomycinicus]
MNVSSQRRALLATATGIALAAGALAVPAAAAPAQAAAAASSKHLHDDFNGDGYADVAIGAPGTALGSQRGAGAVTVLYGSAKGLSTARKQVLTWSGRKNAESPEGGYGSRLRTADLDEDGYADLLSTVSWTPMDGDHGTFIEVNWGGPKGLSATPTLLSGLPDATAMKDFTVADVDGDKHPDLVRLGVHPETDPKADGAVQHGPFTRANPVGTRTTYFTVDPDRMELTQSLTAGDVNGDGIADLAVRTRSMDESDSRGTALLLGGPGGFTNKGWLSDTEHRSIGGEQVVIGDLNHDRYGDIVVGHSDDGYDSDAWMPTKGGALGVVYGGPQGTSTTLKPVWINQDTAGVPGAGEFHDGMGAALSIGDTDGDGYNDLATGLPGEDFDGLTDAGTVLVLRGSAKGLTAKGAKVLHQNAAGVPGTAEKGDRFGRATALIDAGGDKKTELIAGDPDENTGEGAVWAFPATTGGITAKGAFSFGPATAALPTWQAFLGASLGD